MFSKGVHVKISICLSTNPAKFLPVNFKGDLEKNINLIKNLGYDGVELAIRNPDLIDKQWILQYVQRLGLAIPAIGTGQAWGEEGISYCDPDEQIRQQAIERTLSHIPFAKECNATIIIGLLRGKRPDSVSIEQAYLWLREAFSICSKEAAKSHVKIAFEPINRYEVNLLLTVREGLDFIESIGAENLGMLLDTFHMNIEEPIIEESIRIAGNKIFHFHCADSNRWYPGAGHLNFRSIFEALYSTGYDGYVSGEYLPYPDPLESAQKGIHFLRAIESDLRRR